MMTHKNDRVLSVKELARVEGEGALYIRVRGRQVQEARLDIYEPPASSRPSCAAVPTQNRPISPPGSAASARSPTS